MAVTVDLTGQKFGRLLCQHRAENRGAKTTWSCTCDCGTEVVVPTKKIISGRTISCGCARYRKQILTVGLKLGEFTLIKKHPVGSAKTSGRLWDVECSCGKKLTVSTARLRLNKNLNCKSLVHLKGFRTYPETPISYPQEAAEIVGRYLHLLTRLNFLDAEDIGVKAIERGAFICYWRNQQGFPIKQEKAYFLKIVKMAKIQAFNRSAIMKEQLKGRLCQMENNMKVVATAETPPNFSLPKKRRFMIC
jgi:hypothetical protein